MTTPPRPAAARVAQPREIHGRGVDRRDDVPLSCAPGMMHVPGSAARPRVPRDSVRDRYQTLAVPASGTRVPGSVTGSAERATSTLPPAFGHDGKSGPPPRPARNLSQTDGVARSRAACRTPAGPWSAPSRPVPRPSLPQQSPRSAVLAHHRATGTRRPARRGGILRYPGSPWRGES
jgi:hypothetical protein